MFVDSHISNVEDLPAQGIIESNLVVVRGLAFQNLKRPSFWKTIGTAVGDLLPDHKVLQSLLQGGGRDKRKKNSTAARDNLQASRIQTQ